MRRKGIIIGKSREVFWPPDDCPPVFREIEHTANPRLDPQVLDWLKSKGEGHLTRINDIPSNLMEIEKAETRERGLSPRGLYGRLRL